MTLAIIAATVFGRFLLPPLEELFTGKSITNSMEMQRARFAALQQDVRHLHDDLNREQDELDLLALAGVIETQARHIADFTAALVDLVAHHRLAPPLLTPAVVQMVWKMYQEETGAATFPFGPEMVYEAAASYVVTEETLYAVLHLPLLGEAFVYYVQQDFPLILPSGPVFLRPKEEAYLAVTEDDRYYLVLTEEELASCHVLGATRVCAGAVLRTRWTDGCLPALYRGEDVAVRRHCLEVPVQVPWVLSGGGGDPPQHRLWTAERLSYVVQCANGTKQLRDWQSGVHTFQQDRECSIAAEAFYLEPWRKRFQSVDVVRTFSYTSGLDEEWKSSAVVQNLTSMQAVVEPYVNAAPKIFIAACAAVIGVMILFGTLLVLAIRRFRVRSAVEQSNAAPS